jgi:phytoene desaturase
MRRVPGRTDRVVVVGAGLSGLSAALRLAGAGREVTVLEAAPEPGGKAGLLELEGYRFDTGPTVLTMPELIADALDCVGERLEDWLDLVPVDPVYRMHYADGSTLDVRSDPVAMADEVRRVCGPDEAAGYERYVRFLTRLYRAELRTCIDRNLDGPLDLLRPDVARLVALGGFRRLAPKVASFLRDPRTQRAFSFQSLYAGVSPQDALALYAVISYMDAVAGVVFPKGGMHAVPLALAGAAQKHGVDVRCSTRVTRVVVEHGRAVGVETADGERIPADVVVVTADLATAYGELVPSEGGRAPRRLRAAPSCVVLLAGSTQGYTQTAHHDIHVGRAWRRTFREVIHDGELMSDPSLLVTTPTRTDPALTPPGRHSYYVLAPTPNTRAGIDWDVVGPRYRDELVARLEGLGYVGFGAGIEVEHLTTPADWQRQGCADGTPFGPAHTFGQTGPFRPRNLPRDVDGLVFAGAGTTPGVGVPMVLLSGRLAAERITGPDPAYRSRAWP